MDTRNDRPRVALLGEFSAGKSTLANLLLGRQHAPVRVTATQMPPLWYEFGIGAPVRIRADDTEEVLTETDTSAVALEDTKAVRVPLDAPILQLLDLFDMPGSSDPNMAADVWDSLLPSIDIALWCTPATQAWRQSEAAIWDTMPTRLQQRSLLVLTRFDKVGPNDRSRVLSRVAQETAGQFRHILPAALLGLQAPVRACKASGMAQVMAALDDLLQHPEPPAVAPTRVTADEAEAAARPARPPAPPPIAPRRVAGLSTTPQRRQVQPGPLI